MARVLRNEDYYNYIQEKNLNQVIESNWTLVRDVEQAAQQEMAGYLEQRYIKDEILTNTQAFSTTAVYYGKNLVYYTETAFSVTSNYSTGNRVSYNENIYEANQNVTASAWNAAEWDLICEDNLLFYVTLPEAEYDNEEEYEAGDVVWYNNKTWTARSSITGILPTTANAAYWTEGATYSITGDYPDDDSVWTQGDNRNPLIVMRLIDIVLYHLHKRLTGMNFPDIRKEAYDGNSPAQVGGAIGWLKQIAAGKVNVDLPEILPNQNLSVNWGNSGGSTTFTSNTY